MSASPHCVVCGVPLSGAAAVILAWRGIKRSPRNPNMCTQCADHLQEGRLVELTVLFADLSSFTELTGRLGAEGTHKVVDAYLRKASAILASHGATIDKFIGDAVMAFFNVPIARADHSAAAVAAAAELHDALPLLSKELGVELNASIGVAAGFAKVGRLGSDDLKDYTAIGEAVNQAARLQAQAKAREILVSGAVYEKVAAAYPGLAEESLALKGFSQKSSAFRLRGAPAAKLDDGAWLENRPAMNWSAVLLALMGSGCLGKTFVAGVALAYGAGATTALLAFVTLVDGPLRTPLMAGTTLLSVFIFYTLWRQRRERISCMKRNACVEPTPGERRSALAAAAFAALALGFVGFEFWAHRSGKHLRPPMARALSSVMLAQPDVSCAVDSDCKMAAVDCAPCQPEGSAVNKKWSVSCPAPKLDQVCLASLPRWAMSKAICRQGRCAEVR